MSAHLLPGPGPDIATFPHVDAAAEPEALISYLDWARTLPGLRTAKSAALAALGLRPGHTVLDIGCGPGEDSLEMARWVAPGGRVTGIDPSEAMIAEARRRAADRPVPALFRPGDALNLPMEDESADAVRADTLLQHLTDPRRAVAEMVRVIRPGGRVALLEFDLGTLVVDHPDRALTSRVTAQMISSAADGWAGRGLRRLLTEAGLEPVAWQAYFTESAYPFLAGLLAPSLGQLSQAGGGAAGPGPADPGPAVPGEAAARWLADLEQAWHDGRYTAGAVVFVAAGRKPR